MIELLCSRGRSNDLDDVIFLGEVAPADLITGTALSSSIGLSAGTNHNDSEPWLHFIIDGMELFVAKKTLRYSVSRAAINSANAIYGSRTVDINGSTYKVRLLKGAGEDPVVPTAGMPSNDPPQSFGSEWNRLFYPIFDRTGLSEEGIRFGRLARYSLSELGISMSNGSLSWCQEADATQANYYVCRGVFGHHSFQPLFTHMDRSFSRMATGPGIGGITWISSVLYLEHTN